jgi:hypothetical protein
LDDLNTDTIVIYYLLHLDKCLLIISASVNGAVDS